MYISTLFTTALAAATAVLAQSPAGFTPSSTNELGVAYNRTAIIPGILLPTPNVANDLTPGLSANQTTRLHWWGVNYTQATNGAFINTTDAVAPYTGPHVLEGDGVHTYGLFFFDSANYTFPQDALDGTYYDDDTAARFNFSLVSIADEIGDSVMANYFTSTYLNDTDGAALPPAAAFAQLRV